MNIAVFVVIGAALLTLILSPTWRGVALRRVFYRDQPVTPIGHEPRARHWVEGVEVR